MIARQTLQLPRLLHSLTLALLLLLSIVMGAAPPPATAAPAGFTISGATLLDPSGRPMTSSIWR